MVPTVKAENVRLVADRVSFPGAVMPLPVKVMRCGLPLALSVIVISSVVAPTAVGVKTT